jgi:hypothetical protein
LTFGIYSGYKEDMIQTLSEPVSVVSSYNHRTREVKPMSITWGGHMYPVLKVGLRHTYRQGVTRYHVFSVVSNSLFFRLILDTETLHWTVSEVSDGLPD